MSDCFHCGGKSVTWDADFDPEDYGFEGDGVIHELHCPDCGARITYLLIEEEEDERQQDQDQ